MSLARLARTLGALHPLQLAARVPHAIVARLLFAVPGGAGPTPVAHWPPPSEALRAVADAERIRGAARLARLPARSRLHAYEAHYGLELGAGSHELLRDDRSRVAVEPFPAAVRARRLAIAIRCGRVGLAVNLARAARSVALQPEVHLLGNHLLENGFALVCAGAAARGLEADAWFAMGSALLDWQLPQQFLRDGGHFERSASYHLALTHALLESIEIAAASGRGARAHWIEIASRALGFAAAIRAPDGDYPLFNDASLDASPTIDSVLTLGRAMHMPANEPSLMGTAEAWMRRLEPTGWLIGGAGSAWLAIDAGPDGARWQPGHAHADGLSFELWIGGKRTVVDYGVASYAADASRVETRATRTHNTLELAGVDSCEVWGTFRLGRRGKGRVERAAVGAQRVEAELSHDGYRWLQGGPMHRRAFCLRANSLEIRDRVDPAAPATPSPFVSRLRLDAQAALRVRVTASSTVTQRAGSWYPRLGYAAEAVVFEQRGIASRSEVRWLLEWASPAAHLG